MNYYIDRILLTIIRHDNAARYPVSATKQVKTFEDFDTAAFTAMSEAFAAYCAYIDALESDTTPPIVNDGKTITAADIQVDSNFIPILPRDIPTYYTNHQAQIRWYIAKHWGL